MAKDRMPRGAKLESSDNSKPHGDWLTWFGDNKDALGFSIETARRYIKLHERYDDPEQLRGMTTVDAYQSAQILRPQQTELEKAIEGLDSMTADELPKLRARILGYPIPRCFSKTASIFWKRTPASCGDSKAVNSD